MQPGQPTGQLMNNEALSPNSGMMSGRPQFRFNCEENNVYFGVSGVRDLDHGFAYDLVLYGDGFVEVRHHEIMEVRDRPPQHSVYRGSTMSEGLAKSIEAGMSKRSERKLVTALREGLETYGTLFDLALISTNESDGKTDES